jgi:hypothetical protein
MARLYAATGDRIARLDEAGEAWTVTLSLAGAVRSAWLSTRSIPTRFMPVCARAVRAAAWMVADMAFGIDTTAMSSVVKRCQC